MSVSFVSMIKLLFFLFEFSSSLMASVISIASRISRPDFALIDFLPNIDDLWLDIDDLCDNDSLREPADSSEELTSLEFPITLKIMLLCLKCKGVPEWLSSVFNIGVIWSWQTFVHWMQGDWRFTNLNRSSSRCNFSHCRRFSRRCIRLRGESVQLSLLRIQRRSPSQLAHFGIKRWPSSSAIEFCI